jgi:hypothetical protein
MTARDWARSFAAGMGGAFIVANLMVAGAILAERAYTRRLCDAYRAVRA